MSGELGRILRSFGVDVTGTYIDDILIRADTREECARALETAMAVMEALAVPSNKKTTDPSQRIVYLGVEIDTLACEMAVTQEHREYAAARL